MSYLNFWKAWKASSFLKMYFSNTFSNAFNFLVKALKRESIISNSKLLLTFYLCFGLRVQITVNCLVFLRFLQENPCWHKKIPSIGFINCSSITSMKSWRNVTISAKKESFINAFTKTIWRLLKRKIQGFSFLLCPMFFTHGC